MSELNNTAYRSDLTPLGRIAREISEDTTRMGPQDAEALVTEVATRLGSVRGELSDNEFIDLVRDVVRTKIRFSELDTAEFEAPMPEGPIPQAPRRAD